MRNSIKKTARIGGILYLIIIVTGIFAEIFVRSKLTVSGDATATANNIMASESLWRIGFASELILLVCDITVTLILYTLLRPTSKTLALLAVFFRLVSIAISGINALNHFAVLFFLSGADYLKVFEPHQLHALALLSLKYHSYGYNISLTFFGFHCLCLGYLLFRSSYFSRIFGILLTITGLCYLTNSFSWFLAPTFAAVIFPMILLPCLLGELSLSLWLIVKGVNVPKWEKQVSSNR